MKLNAETAGKQHAVSIEQDGGRLTATIDERTVELEVSEPEPGVYLLKSGGRIFEASVSRAENGFQVSLQGHTFDINITDPKRLRGAGSQTEHASGRAEIRTAMPGKVVRILHQVGDDVEKGQGVIVVEAMKMQNEMRSPKSGVIAEIKTSEGETVSAGDVLVVIE